MLPMLAGSDSSCRFGYTSGITGAANHSAIGAQVRSYCNSASACAC
jgi:hypothetical protein